ncbi:MAG: hydroxyacylglutathione hydrolase [Candidatus Xenolissoclinum pacificiensis L6]|uniref:Hydroxyacylglutathione hydrolase n=1 Tax=Candidatus Xenolissoclinum pacificiensis L6 TaxID=1401685 RepID=W2V1B7_9RICK|nr:MAG: hydroxyacylglutathione hydrolase [Candidatus Xenolissoclinum pacificiensis L6]
MLDIEIIPLLKDNYCYFITDPVSKMNALIDPSTADEVLVFLQEKNLKLDFILNTHHHWDHVDGNLKIKEYTGAKIVGNIKDQDRIPGIDILVRENEIWYLGEQSCKILNLSGHTIGHIGYLFEGVVFTGDAVFSCGCGRLFEGNAEMMLSTFNRILSLPDECLMYCGHEYTYSNIIFCLSIDPSNLLLKDALIRTQEFLYKRLPSVPSSIGFERKANVFLRYKEDEIIKRILPESYHIASDSDVIAEMRRLKDVF